MKRFNSIIAALLCFMMVFNPVLFEAVLWAEDAAQTESAQPVNMETSEQSASEASAKTDDAYKQLTNTKPGKNKMVHEQWYQK
ncbi:MAG: hypothetical protein PHD82_07320 [Candidatus Riflebacteria bacterium]|nr:hypothetical protein [Candidatus Riflebacteria bacterium]